VSEPRGKDRVCKNCRYWQDYEARVWVAVRDKEAADRGTGLVPRGDGTAEARPCRYQPNPNTSKLPVVAYTGINYTGEDFRSE